tara:strand:+ start:414 stop:1586 length:1173 start_codon:yes stop_codon:yes gene_type:complete
MNNFNEKISIIIPTFNCIDNLTVLFQSIDIQTIIPDEVIIVDCSTNKKIENYCRKKNYNFDIIYKHLNKSYPGKSRNYGLNFIKNNMVGLLDVKTLPKRNWLENYLKLIIQDNKEIIFGKTKYTAKNFKQKIILSSTFGNIFHETTPGSLFYKEIFLKNHFIDNVRSGDDLEWRNRIKKSHNTFTPEDNYLEYNGLPNSLISFMYKYFIYSLYNSKVNVQNNIKDAYLGLFIILASLIVPRWNYLIGNWNNNPLYIPNITKYYFLFLMIFFLFIYFINIISKEKNNFSLFIFKILIFIFFTISVYKWNNFAIYWLENSIFYIPHVTKIYLSILIIFSIFYRGVYLPLSRKVFTNFLFPFNWFFIGFYGLCLDIVKAPGYILGGILKIFYK